MLAHHPETGQPIRILRSEAQITQSRRTLVWLRAGYSQSTRWLRWNTIITDPAASQGPAIGLVIQEFTPAWIPLLQQVGEQCMVIYKDAATERAIQQAGFKTEQYLSYADLYHMYPFLGEPVLPTDPVEKVVISVAHILRFPYLAWTPEGDLDSVGVKAQIQAWMRACGGQQQVLPANAIAEEVVPSCWLIQQYFKHATPRRAKEIAQCLEKNLANPYIDHVLLLNERDDYVLPTSEKLVTRTLGHRLTYQDVLEAVKTEVSANSFVIFANSDIWCDESLAVLWAIPMAERRLFLALLRWEDKGDEEPVLFGPRPDSQDTWILAKETVDFAITEEEFGFPFGKPGCDNAIALAMLKRRCLVVNPAYSVKTHHIHASNIRDYNPRDVLYKPMYLYLDPTPIQLFTVEEHMKAWESKTYTAAWRGHQPIATVSRRIHHVNEAAAKTVCRAIADREGEELRVDGANLWTPSPTATALYEMKNTFASDTGLLSNFGAIFVGQHEVWRDGWRDSTLSSVTTTLHVPALVSVTVGTECWKSLATWCLQYLPTVLRIRKLAGCEYEFLVPTLPQVPPFLYDCKWRDNHVGTVPHIPNTQYYCGKVIAPAPPTGAVKRHVTKEDIQLLRELLHPITRKSGRTVVICVEEGEDAVFHAGWVEEWRTCHAVLLRGARILTVRPSDSPKVRREAFQAADWIFGRREALQWLWMARPDTRIVEWMLETDISSEIIHLAGAADCKYILSLVRKEPVEFQRQNAILEFTKLWVEYAFPETVDATVKEKPVIVLPAGKGLTGMFAHSGDSFREMVRIWEERGYCEVQETEESGYVWWNTVGDVLLYDWNSARWWDPVTNYQLALFGNCVPPGPEGHEKRQSIWSFWGKSPRALEAAAAEGRPGWDERPIQSLFLGKVETGVQKTRRCSMDWKSAVDLFSMPVDSTGAPYPYTQSEYLEKLQQARYGLCLPGSGVKCNREIEYFALGVVPIAITEVDFTQYLVPPREGEHYFRASSPEEVRRIVSETTAEKWEAMSSAGYAWWRQNASAEGLFRLTWGRIQQCRPFQGLMIPIWPQSL
jgi:hypothetical protein